MIHFSEYASRLRRPSSLAVLVGVLAFVSEASAIDLDFSVASGNYNVAGNWIETATGAVAASPPTVADNAYVRNNGTLAITTDTQHNELRIGYRFSITPGDYNDDAIVDGGDYVVWRKGGPLLNDSTPGNQPGDYTVWRSNYGNTTDQFIGAPGTLNWTAGKITGPNPDPTAPTDQFSGGPDIRIGRIESLNNVIYEFPGTAVQNGATTELLLPYRQSQLNIGDGGSATHTPNSSYTLAAGTIGTAIGNSFFQNDGTNSNNGINVRNGTFTMTNGNIIDVTPPDYFLAGPLVGQRFMTIATARGTGPGNEAIATATLSGGNINVLGGVRVATDNDTRGTLNINGPITIKTGADVSIGYQPTMDGTIQGHNALGVMNMSAGSWQIGRTDIMDHDPNTGLARVAPDMNARFQVGDRGPGILNMSGGYH